MEVFRKTEEISSLSTLVQRKLQLTTTTSAIEFYLELRGEIEERNEDTRKLQKALEEHSQVADELKKELELQRRNSKELEQQKLNLDEDLQV